ncbi:MAG: hypothetical protein A3F31_01280 [Candidatus Levybacteria bacterium RIFCSPHIGHO2_12_FULL_38_12]|nr:MAG: hypothetical protein A2770_02030 [Candidatus Levybacteria bacterium RIFCSPHIGHO2_01_FULL_38_12]OGH23294.1 MAG: hypothetical protein A3F31_01280 [Candidatus Levybacteria bacterium RIFCSPHIGHO2_12_FULL_38_12]OGH34437.1 MAG: hypothetical protein A3A47_00200 [Candidatus Levybacteria bacterium RIFCSPLOWO2_01_FULL_37_20]
MNKVDLLYKDLSFQIQGAIIEVRKNYGSGHKESLYHHALEEEFSLRNVSFKHEPPIKVISPKTGKTMGIYIPDFLVDNKIILEIKALEIVPRKLIDQLFDYLRNSSYELGYFINFSGPRLYMKRIIYTNDRKFSGV